MDAFSQTVSAFLDLADDSETEGLESLTSVNPSLVNEALLDWKPPLVVPSDSTKKRHRPKIEPANDFDDSWTEIKTKSMTFQQVELAKLELLTRKLKLRSKRHCSSTIPDTREPKSIKTKQTGFESEGMNQSMNASTRPKSCQETEEMEHLYGCPKCRFRWGGCRKCKTEEPLVSRPKLRWNPKDLHFQAVPAAPVFYPSIEEFSDPFVYISKIRSEAQNFGICTIVPPENWTSSFDPQVDCKGGEESQFCPKKQLVSSLCIREADIQSQMRSKTRSNRHEKTKSDSDGSSDDEFGFSVSEMPFSVLAFKAFADWSHHLHFKSTKKSSKSVSIRQIEGEFWRLVEGGENDDFETFYGSDLDSRRFRKTIGSNPKGHVEWEVSRWPRSPHSLLRQIPGDDLITGVMVPWIYFGSSLSAFCWHVEDHALYSVNYLHAGAAKIWYGVPSSAAIDFELAMKDALPHLFETDPQLLHRLVTHLSPQELQKRGIPVYRIEHKPGTFVVTFPNSYHGGFNSGWNCAEAVNFAPADWLPHGTDVLKKYKQQKKPTTFSHDALLIKLVSSVHTPPVTHEVDSLTLKYAVGELSLRIKEEEEKREIAFQAGIVESKRMEDFQTPNGSFQKNEEMDCEVCRCDLYFSAVFSPQKELPMVCPEHASTLPSPRILLYRYALSELHEMVKQALELFPECGEYIARAFHRVNRQMTGCFVQKGPFYNSSEL